MDFRLIFVRTTMPSIVDSVIIPQSQRVISNNILQIRQEHFGEDTLNLFDKTFKSLFKGIKEFSVSEFVGELTSVLGYILKFSNPEYNRNAQKVKGTIRDFTKKIDKFNYVHHADILLPCPDGFDGNFTEYVQALAAAEQQLIQTAVNQLDSFKTYLAVILSDANSRVALNDNKRHIQTLTKVRVAEDEKFLSFFNTGQQQRMPLAKMFSDKHDLAAGLNTVAVIFDRLEKINLKDIHQSTEEISSRMELVIDLAQGKSDIEVSRQVLVNILEGAQETALQVEHLAKYISRCEIALSLAGFMVERLDGKK